MGDEYGTDGGGFRSYDAPETPPARPSAPDAADPTPPDPTPPDPGPLHDQPPAPSLPYDRPPGHYGPPSGPYGGTAGQYGGPTQPPPGQYGGSPGQYGGPTPPPAGQFGGPPGQYGPPSGQYGGPSQPPAGQYGGPPGQYGPPPGQYGGGQYGGPTQPPPGHYGGSPGQYGGPSQPSAGQYGGPPSGQFGGPPGQHGGAAYPRADEVQYGPLPAYQQPGRRRGRMLVAAIATGTAVVLTAGGVYAYSALSGGAGQLAARTPGDAVAYLEVNLDPPAAQKVAAIRFLRRFPDAKAGDESGSLIDSVIEPLIPDATSRRLFTEDIKTWLGKHAAVAGDPQDGTIQTVVLAETTDEAKSRAGLDRINAEQPNETSKVRYAIADGVVYLAETQRAADTAAHDGRSATLDANGTFTGDVDTVGADGIVTFWSDLAAAARFDPQTRGAVAQGRVAGTLHFTDTTADLRIRTFDNPTKIGTQPVGPRLAALPADTAVAIGLSGGDQLVRSAYEQLEKAGLGRSLDRAQRDSGLRLPDDVAALVGSGTIIAAGGTADQLGFGLVTTTDDPAGARRAADAVLAKLDPDSSLTVRSTADGTVLASTSAYADQLTGSGALGQQELFRSTLPDLDGATAVVYVDLRRAADISGDELPAEAKALRSFGLTASSAGGDSILHLRLVAG